MSDSSPAKKGALVYRHPVMTRLTHWLWAICLFFLLGSGLGIFNAHPALYWGNESGFAYNNAAFVIGSQEKGGTQAGFVDLAGFRFDTTGFLGVDTNGKVQAFPSWSTLPSRYSLATSRVIHFFFAWILVATLIAWLVHAIASQRLRRDLVPSLADLRHLPSDIANHLRLRLRHDGRYNVLQKLAYMFVLVVALPGMIATGLAMSPGFNAIAPWLADMLGGRQTARTLHFVLMVALLGFFVIHIIMILVAGPLNELRSIVTGWYRTDSGAQASELEGTAK